MYISAQQRTAVLAVVCFLLAGVLAGFLQRQVPAVAEFMDSGESSGSMDINSATYGQIMARRAVPQTLARRIIALRDARGGFSSMEQLLEVKGIGPKRLEKLKGLFHVE